MTVTTSPLTDALAAVERALKDSGVTPVRLSISAALHRLEYQLLDGDIVAIVGWTDGLFFVDDELGPEIGALVIAHAHLACAFPPDMEDSHDRGT